MKSTTRAIELPGLAALAAVVRDAAHLPGLLVYVADELGDNATAETRSCGSVLRVGIGADLLEERRSAALLGSVAHEVAHHALGHLTGLLVPALERVAVWSYTVAVVAAVVAPVPRWVTPVLLVVALSAYLVARWWRRAAEYAADRHAVSLLDGLGLPGRQVVTAMLREDLEVEPAWYAVVGRLAGSHPPAISRLHRIAAVPVFADRPQEVT
ncbi:M48 family metalloprotease [Nonomuraea sp. NPDC050691]|uniref:M48 family metalloprotease n=1 Tax=Nonomuraea sp. NPDC050691 TaxID=3155661 RepID=UPI0033E48F67